MAVYPLTVFYDGACPICAREMALMKRLDRRQRLTLLDFSLAGFAAPADLAVTDLSAVIHAQWADGTVITGVEVFRAIWEAIGLGFLSRLSRLPLVAPLMVTAYGWFARNRLWLTGRSNACPGNACAAASPASIQAPL
jgi:predicted DCC family thiol-disulfide oxidoreductase YuxK